ncbi:MAG: 3-isopropylmalate dehydratase [Candidatus Sigynarchaeota archaeon]
MANKTREWKISFDGENKGTAWVMGNDVSTDDIIAGKFLEIRDMESLSIHVFERFGNDFARNVKPGDVIIAGNNFGCGSSREQAPYLLKLLGVGAIFACSFARIFYRNAINIGLPAIIIEREDYTSFKTSDPVVYTLDPIVITNARSKKKCLLQPLPVFIMQILHAGGAISLLKKQLARK